MWGRFGIERLGSDGGGDGGGDDAGREDVPGVDAPRRDANLPMGDLPSGDMGIAARYPGDIGIGGDDDVVFFDDFESYGSGDDLDTNWNAGVFWNADIETDPAHVLAGDQSLRFTAPQQDEELSNGVARTISPELDVLFLRWYGKFDGSFDISGSSHNGGGISAHYYIDGRATPGIPADGMNKFLIEYECWRGEPSEPNPGSLNVYIYHPEQRSVG